ncbi:hypothetical protein OC845_001943 [Tilletia horrida]|nr:hypothetical protein OC845_001943 [Tilletia horrida]
MNASGAAAPASPSSSKTLSILPTTPKTDTRIAQAGQRGSDPRARGYPEGMFSTPSRRMIPEIVIPTSEPRTDEVSGISDSSSLSSRRSTALSPHKRRYPMSPLGHASASKKRRHEGSPLRQSSKLNRDGMLSDARTSGRDGSPLKSGSSSSSNSASDSDDELPELAPPVRNQAASRIQPRRAAAGSGSTSGLSAINKVPRTVVPVIQPAKRAPILKTSLGTNLSIAAMLKRKKEQARLGTDLDGMDEADALVRETEEREKEALRRKLAKETEEKERREVEAMQRELDQAFLSPKASRKISAPEGQISQTSTGETSSNNSAGPSKELARHTEKAEGGCDSDGMDEESSSSQSDDEEELNRPQKKGEQTAHSSAQTDQRLSGVTRTLQDADIDGRDALLGIIASDHGIKTERKEAEAAASGRKRPRTRQDDVWRPGRVELPKFVVGSMLQSKPLGSLFHTALKDGPWALVAVLQQLSLLVRRPEIAEGEMLFLLNASVYGVDSRYTNAPLGGAAIATAPAGIFPGASYAYAHPWRMARRERQAVSEAACKLVDSLTRPPLMTRPQNDATAPARLNAIAGPWAVQLLANLGAASSYLEKLQTHQNPEENFRRPKSVPRQVRKMLRNLTASHGRRGQGVGEGDDAIKIDPEKCDGPGVVDIDAKVSEDLCRVGWLSLEERSEALTRFGVVIRALCEKNILSLSLKADLTVMLAAFCGAPPEDAGTQHFGATVQALLDTAYIDWTYEEELAGRVFKAYKDRSVTSLATMLRALPAASIQNRAFSRAVAWQALEHAYEHLHKPGTDIDSAMKGVEDGSAADDRAVNLIAKHDLALIRDLVTTHDDAGPFWISTAADEARNAGEDGSSSKETADGKPAPTQSLPGRRLTDYDELTAWAEIVSVALSDIAVQATSFKKQTDGQQTASGPSDLTPTLNRRQPRPAKASLLLATRPFTAAIQESNLRAGDSQPEQQVVTSSVVPEPDAERIRMLNTISKGLRGVFNKIVDFRGSSLERSRAKDSIQRIHIRLHYLVAFYFNNGRVGEQLKLSEIYANEQQPEEAQAAIRSDDDWSE